MFLDDLTFITLASYTEDLNARVKVIVFRFRNTACS